MWRENLIELKKQKGLTPKQIADKSKLPEKTVIRILNGTTTNPTIDSVLGVVLALGGSLDVIFEIFMGTQAVLGDETLAKLQQDCEVLRSEVTRLNQELVDTNLKLTESELDIKRLNKEMELKDELISVYRYHIKAKGE